MNLLVMIQLFQPCDWHALPWTSHTGCVFSSGGGAPKAPFWTSLPQWPCDIGSLGFRPEVVIYIFVGVLLCLLFATAAEAELLSDSLQKMLAY